MLARTDELADAERALDPGVPGRAQGGDPGGGRYRQVTADTSRGRTRGGPWVARRREVGSPGSAIATPYSGWQPVMRSIVHDDEDVAAGAGVAGARRRRPRAAPRVPFIGRRLEETPTVGDASAARYATRWPRTWPLARSSKPRRANSPLVIELEDWHWADRSSARLLDLVTVSSQRCADRDRGDPAPAAQKVPPFPVREDDIVIDLGELDDDEAREVAATVAARTDRDIDDARLARIVERAAGNPLMIEAMVDLGDDALLATGLAPLLQARLDGLPDEDLRPLIWASAFGRPIVVDELDAAMTRGDESEPTLASQARGPRAPRIARRADAGRDLPRFRHASVREAAYQRLSHGSRRMVHGSIGRTLERRDAQPVEIARHFALTDDLDRQRTWYPAAGVQSSAAWAVEDAIIWFDRRAGHRRSIRGGTHRPRLDAHGAGRPRPGRRPRRRPVHRCRPRSTPRDAGRRDAG